MATKDCKSRLNLEVWVGNKFLGDISIEGKSSPSCGEKRESGTSGNLRNDTMGKEVDAD